MRDSWLLKSVPLGPRRWAELKRQFRAFGVPAEVCETLQRWGPPPEEIEPVLRLVRKIVSGNAIHHGRMRQLKWVTGQARDPHYKETPEESGALRPILKIVERVLSDLERLIEWQFKPPKELQELDIHLNPTGRKVSLSRLDEDVREAFARARRLIVPWRRTLREATRRSRGRKAMLVHPLRPKPVRPRELERMLRDEILLLHPNRERRARAARAAAEIGRASCRERV